MHYLEVVFVARTGHQRRDTDIIQAPLGIDINTVMIGIFKF